MICTIKHNCCVSSVSDSLLPSENFGLVQYSAQLTLHVLGNVWMNYKTYTEIFIMFNINLHHVIMVNLEFVHEMWCGNKTGEVWFLTLCGSCIYVITKLLFYCSIVNASRQFVVSSTPAWNASLCTLDPLKTSVYCVCWISYSNAVQCNERSNMQFVHFTHSCTVALLHS